MSNFIAVAIDGPAGAGKSSVAKAVSAKLGYIYADTGALYRAVGLYAVNKGVDTKDAEAVSKMIEKDTININIAFSDGVQHVILNGEDVNGKIRTPEISMAASNVSAVPKVRQFLFDLQRDLATKNNIIMDGRDIGTVVLPNAQVKIFLTASAEERANRRSKELLAKGMEVNYNEILEDIKKRDDQDMNRPIAPLKAAEDAVIIDSSDMSFDEVVAKLISVINEKV